MTGSKNISGEVMGKTAVAEGLAEFVGQRRYPAGAEVLDDGTVHFRVWAPRCRRVAVTVIGANHNDGDGQSSRTCWLTAESNGWYSGWSTDAHVGSLYGFRLDNDERLYPDPASRFQPDGPHGVSQVIDANSYKWSDENWKGVSIAGQVIYEMHIGTFTTAGTWAAAQEQLSELASCGVTVVEVMPVAEFPGRFGWGYDGVCLFAPTRLYGTPDDFRRFVDRAHQVGIGVILDVVYNHVGPDGNFLSRFSEDYFTNRYRNDWGPAINFDGKNSSHVREFYTTNATYWIDEFHLDGLRLDATQDIHDASDEHILKCVTRCVRIAAGTRSTIVVAENEPQSSQLALPEERRGYGIDGVWNDDFHHSAMVALCGHNEAYYTDYLGSPQEFISAVKYGYLYQGQWYEWQKQRRGSPTRGTSPPAFITFIQNHDQVANSAAGQRCHLLSSPGCYRAMTALFLLGPGTPMIFQGQEFAASTPFFYFADHADELAKKVANGRKEMLKQFRSIALPEIQNRLPDPADPATFIRSKLDFSERKKHAGYYRMHCDLLALRRSEAVFRAQRTGGVDGAVLGTNAFVLRFFGKEDPIEDRLLLVNFGRDLYLRPTPEPLLAPPLGAGWEIQWSSEDPMYGGSGTAPLDADDNWRVPGQAAVVMRAISSHHAPS